MGAASALSAKPMRSLSARVDGGDGMACGHKKTCGTRFHRSQFLSLFASSFQLCQNFVCLKLSSGFSSSSAVSNSRVSSNRVSSYRVSSAINNYAISYRVSSSCVRSFVTARSERDSCESYEHEN